MAVRRSVRTVETSAGTARVHRATPTGASTRPLLVLGHGAGGGVEAGDLQQVSVAVLRAGFGVVLVDQPWRVAGRRIAPRPATLDVAWVEVLGRLRHRGPLLVGGRSAGARVACRTAEELGAVGVVALAFPLHPPGRPEASRAHELSDAGRPVLVIQGDRDPFGTAEEIEVQAPSIRVVTVVGGDHSLVRGDLGVALPSVIDFLRGFVE